MEEGGEVVVIPSGEVMISVPFATGWDAETIDFTCREDEGE